MGVGKTTIGKHLAKVLRLEFIDSDHEIENRTGVAIPTIFDIEGEDGFRKREAEVLAQLVQQDGIILATGGGIVLLEENREMLKENGFVVYLKSSPDLVYSRIARDSRRPLLQNDDPKATLTKIMHDRDPLYSSIADLTIDTSRLNIKQVIERIYNHKVSV